MKEIKEDDCWEISTKWESFRLAEATEEEATEVSDEIMSKFIAI
ncbi:hypothetical protein [Flavobacterium piscis]|nr:hypothetical protein [Flavobacterium piscis]